jgi:hypothetical protein
MDPGGADVPRILALFAATLVLAGCESGPAGPLPAEPDQLVLYSIDLQTWAEVDFNPAAAEATGKLLDGYPVLGKVPITDLAQRRQVLSAIRRAVRKPPPGKACFVPRHALRAVKGNEIVDMVICFECGNYKHYQGGRLVSAFTPPISSDAEPLFDKILTDAGVPLAPKPKPK